MPGRPILAVNAQPFVCWNYFEGFVYLAAQGHGEIVTLTNGTGASPPPQFCYNTILQPTGVAIGGSNASIYAFGNTTPSASFTSFKIDHNTVVTNLNTGQPTTTWALTVASYQSFPILTITNNRVDATGSNFTAGCNSPAVPPAAGPAVVSAAGLTFTGNINLLTGGASPAFNPQGTCVVQ